MPMERSVSLAERSTAAAPAKDLRCHSASYAASYAPTKVQRASLSRPVQRSGSTRTVSGAGPTPTPTPTPGLNLRCYSASYAASYKPFSDGAAQSKKGHNTTSTTAWSSAGRRSLNLRSYTPSFSALVDNDNEAPAKTETAPDDADAELQRKKRLVGYKVYDVEGKVKGSVRRSVKWIKVKCSRAVYGW